VGLETGARIDDVVVVDQQQPVMGVGRVMVAAEAEAVLAVQPAEPGREPLPGSADVDLGAGVAAVIWRSFRRS